MSEVLKSDVKELIENRQLSHWHLMIASLLGSLASQEKMFNQAFLNMLLKHSMQQFIIPYFEGLIEYQETMKNIPEDGSLQEKIKPVVDFIDNVFELAGDIRLSAGNDGNAVVTIGSSGCRFCPVGVGKANITPGMTFCPFPTMIEETARALIAQADIKTVLHREGLKTRVLTKEDGCCHISYQFSVS